MRILITILLFASLKVSATNIWVSTSGTNTGTSSAANPWSTSWYQTHKNQIAGDSIFFKRGDVFPFVLPVTVNSGTSAARIYYGDYGTGAKPVFNTFTTIVNWTVYSGSIYYATVDVPRLQIVTVDGALQPMGRYPKTGYLTIQGHSGLSTVTSTAIGTIPFDPAGGEFVTRKARYIIDRHNITSRSGNTLNITSPSDFGPSGNYGIDNGNGFFIQNALGTLTQLGDWYYDKTAKRLYMHFGAGNSSSHVIQASLVNEAANVQGKAYIILNNLDIRGGTTATVNALYAANITVTNCSLSMGTEGIWTAAGGILTSANMNFSSNYIASMFSNGICAVDVDNVTATYNTIRDIHTVPGMGRSGDAVGSGMSITGGNNQVLSWNVVSNTGYCGIASYKSAIGGGDNIYIENNIIDTYSVNKDDAGGLYLCGQKSAPVSRNRRIKGNWVKNGIGNVEGVSNKYAMLPFASAVYLDNYANQVNVENNLISDNSGAGVFFNSTNTDTVANNTIFNSGFVAFLLLARGGDEVVHDLYVHHNQFIAKTPAQILEKFEIYENPSTRLPTIGTFNNNTFYRPFGTTSYIRVDNRSRGGQIVTDYTLSSWLTTYSKEQSSINSTVPIADGSKFRIHYNQSALRTIVNLNGIYKDLGNTLYSGKIPIQPCSGKVLIYNAALPTPNNNRLKIKVRRMRTTP